ncbi:MAG: hypothetical protein AABY22_31740, partial [Nanoarchaeota archaeon]
DVFSFSVLVNDMNVIVKGKNGKPDSVGAPRNFMVVDLDGSWTKGWDVIEFLPTAPENAFLSDKKLWTGNQVVFKNWVHPNRWASFYGQYYFLTKALIDRLEDEASWLYQECKTLRAAGVTDGTEDEDYEDAAPKTTVGKAKKIEVEAFESQVDFGGLVGSYQTLHADGVSVEGNEGILLAAAQLLRKKIVYTILPQLRFATRCVEMAFVKHGLKEHGSKLPTWLRGVEWERGVVLPGKRTAWNRMSLGEGIALRYRFWKKKETVAG